jgi:hypothetical protein
MGALLQDLPSECAKLLAEHRQGKTDAEIIAEIAQHENEREDIRRLLIHPDPRLLPALPLLRLILIVLDRMADRQAKEAAKLRAISKAIENDLVAAQAAMDAAQAAMDKVEIPQERLPARPPRTATRRGFAEEDEPLVEEMHRQISAGEAKNPWQATNAVADRAAGPGTLHSKRQRLLKRFTLFLSTV